MPTIHKGALALSSPAFAHGEPLPDRFTCTGAGVSPPLAWTDPPEGTRAFALVSDDPDAPLTHGFVHWVVYDIPADVVGLEEGDTSTGTAGVNGAGQAGFFPASPPRGDGDHFYYFHLYALDAALDLEPGLDKATLLARIDEHIIEQARLVGRFGR